MIEPVEGNRLEEILPLIRDYQAFYEVPEISDERNRTFFSRFGPHNPEGCQFLYREGSTVAGFATVYFSYTSTIAARVGILNDLFTLPEYRGNGVGRSLVEHCREFAGSRGAARLQWVTALDNSRAQVLYDALDTRKSSWHFYTYNT